MFAWRGEGQVPLFVFGVFWREGVFVPYRLHLCLKKIAAVAWHDAAAWTGLAFAAGCGRGEDGCCAVWGFCAPACGIRVSQAARRRRES